MTTQTTFETKVAIAKGFHEAHLIEKGEEFLAPTDFKGKWFVPKNEAPAAEEAEKRFLDGKAKDIVTQLADKSLAELKALVDEETSGQRRKGVLAALDDAIVNVLGKIGEQTEDAKDGDPFQ